LNSFTSREARYISDRQTILKNVRRRISKFHLSRRQIIRGPDCLLKTQFRAMMKIIVFWMKLAQCLINKSGNVKVTYLIKGE